MATERQHQAVKALLDEALPEWRRLGTDRLATMVLEAAEEAAKPRHYGMTAETGIYDSKANKIG